jgi:DNA-directed RNA polymerase specialized sigma24 family protein
MDDKILKDLAKSTKALLLVQLQAQAKPEEQEKPEILLARAGFVAREIAELLGKSHAAVAKALHRAGKAA